MTIYHVYIGTIEDPIGTGLTVKSAKNHALATLISEGFIGPDEHQFPTAADALDAMTAKIVDREER